MSLDFFRRVLLWGIALAGAMSVTPAQAFADGDTCPRPPVGSVVMPPPDLFSSGGVLNVTFDYHTSVDDVGRTLYCFVTPDGMESPTLHVNPGDTLWWRT